MTTVRACFRRQAIPRSDTQFLHQRRYASFLSDFLKQRNPSSKLDEHPAVQTIPTCPPARKAFAPTPQLDIDRRSTLLGTMAPHRAQIVVCTGRASWESKIETATDGWIAHGLKDQAKSGRILSTHAPVLVSFSDYKRTSESSLDFYVFPTFRYVTMHKGGLTDESQISRNIAMILNDELSGGQDPALQELRLLMKAESLDSPEVHVLVCGHMKRDKRCGMLGEPLRREFTEKLRAVGVDIFELPPGPHNAEVEPFKSARIGLISHIGGHKFAGNVIIRIPPRPGHPLSGREIWYGRVEPRHVEGIVEETILKGNVIQELLRGIN